jgi:hypothetical protein
MDSFYGTALRLQDYLRLRHVLLRTRTSSALMHHPDLLLSNPPSLSEPLRCRADELLSRIVRANYNTQFARTAPELTEFRDAITGRVDGVDGHIISESFRNTVHLTTYDSYAPFLAGFFEKPCKASAIVDMFAPGLPDYLCESSSTSGGQAKIFPKYNRLSKVRSSDAGSSAGSNTLRKRTAATIWYFGCDQMTVENEDNSTVAKIYLAPGSVVGQRTHLNLDPEKDGEKMGTFGMGYITKITQLQCLLTCHPPSTRPRCTVCRWIYKEMALFPSCPCTVCSH